MKNNRLILVLLILSLIMLLMACSGAEKEDAISNTEVEKTTEQVVVEVVEEEAEVKAEEKSEVAFNHEPIVNGDFEKGQENWSTYFHFDAAGVFEVVAGQAMIKVERDGDEDYSIHLYQGQFTLDDTKTYTLTFDAMAKQEHDLLVVLENSKYDRHVSETVRLTSVMQTFTLDFQVPEEPVSLKLLFGELGGKVSGENEFVFDNVHIAAK
ncbi:MULTISPECIES: carbohydrate binding domain-containing protein [unclassified Fusibacter]|uniref:carbohydrate binding domain-containing protein n=1 Tax=unclassified Fusibacter TaxID=2624464 RepID=UPI001010592E|nr:MULTISPECIES: carbohydrate binding domain-containing protein [unclassified Fusibacter]MCK8058130.1 carbohydrate binding domain-containing protein [Fusibacter sp. A2]NPE20712.1 hypothetical protein [Fusibacter sp. A1]RXV62916.1 hypothetical protein DWB64_02680 [Fusibacter sp. A1]